MKSKVRIILEQKDPEYDEDNQEFDGHKIWNLFHKDGSCTSIVRKIYFKRSPPPPILHLVCDPRLDLSDEDEDDDGEKEIDDIQPPTYYFDTDENENDEKVYLFYNHKNDENIYMNDEEIPKKVEFFINNDEEIIDEKMTLEVLPDEIKKEETNIELYNEDMNDSSVLLLNKDIEENREEFIMSENQQSQGKSDSIITNIDSNFKEIYVTIPTTTHKMNKNPLTKMERVLNDATELKLECENLYQKLKNMNTDMNELLENIKIIFTIDPELNETTIQFLNRTYVRLYDKILIFKYEIESTHEKFVPMSSYVYHKLIDEFNEIKEKLEHTIHFKSFETTANHFIENIVELHNIECETYEALHGIKVFYSQMQEKIKLNRNRVDAEFLMARKMVQPKIELNSPDEIEPILIEGMTQSKSQPPAPAARTSSLLTMKNDVPEVRNSTCKRIIAFHSSTKRNDEDNIEGLNNMDNDEKNITDETIKKSTKRGVWKSLKKCMGSFLKPLCSCFSQKHQQ